MIMRTDKGSQREQVYAPERILGKRLPAAVEAEKALLGALLLNDENVSHVAELLVPKDFYIPAHRHVYEAILTIFERSERIDIITLQNELEKKGVFQDMGGVVYLLSLQEDIPSVGLVTQHANIIKEKSVLRELINSATDIISNCYSQEEQEISEILDSAEKTIFQISHKRTDQSFVQIV